VIKPIQLLFPSLKLRRSVFSLYAISLFFCFSSSSTLANTNDTQQPVEITANKLVSNEKLGVSEYQGDVQITQGSFKLTGNKVKISHPDNQLENIFATGKPATFKQFNAQENAWINGQADEIFYNAAKKTVKLTGNAAVQQENKHQIKGNSLIYDMTLQTLQGSGSEKQRIEVILQPNQTTNSGSKSN